MISFFDKLISLVAIIILLPLLLAISAIVFFDMGSPVFFRQKRVGQHGKIFEIIKFRSMANTAYSAKQAHLEKHRISKIGNLLRNSNLDELPQLLNVIKGDMSLVGPRPHEVHQDAEFVSEICGYKKRYTVPHGLTGLAQVSGYSGPITSMSFLKKRVAYDICWARNRSLCLYLKILIMTAAMFIKPRHRR